MNSLTELYQLDVEQLNAEVAKKQAEGAQRKALLAQKSLRHFRGFFRTWEPLQGLLGLKDEPTIDDLRDQIVWRGTTAINNLAVTTVAWIYVVGESPNLRIQILAEGDDRISVIGEISSSWEAGEYPKALGRLCSTWMEQYNRMVAIDQKVEADRLAHLSVARRYIGLARIYEERRQRVEEKLEMWAVEWAAKLWEPHKLWKVRYMPVGSLVEEDAETGTIVVMEEPGDIITALRQFPTATVTAVSLAGDVTEVEIPSFLDAQVLTFTEPTVTEPLPYHVRYAAGRFTINVPPYSGRRPAPAPSIVSWRSYLAECEVPVWVSDIPPATVAALTPEQFINEHSEWLMV